MILVKQQWKKIKIAYNNTLRRLLALPKHNSADEMFVNMNILSFGELLRKFVYSFQSRLIMLGGIPFLQSSRVITQLYNGYAIFVFTDLFLITNLCTFILCSYMLYMD